MYGSPWAPWLWITLVLVGFTFSARVWAWGSFGLNGPMIAWSGPEQWPAVRALVCDA